MYGVMVRQLGEHQPPLHWKSGWWQLWSSWLVDNRLTK